MIEERRVSIVPGLLWSLGRKVEDLLALQRTVRESRDAVDSRLRALEDRMTYLEAHQERLVGEARSAANAASTAVAGAVISDVVTRLTRVEMATEGAAKRLAPAE
jgi:glutathione S-transferase